MVEHFKVNNLVKNSEAILGAFASHSGGKMAISWEDNNARKVTTYNLISVMKGFSEIDIIDLDVQGAEGPGLLDNPQVIDAVNKKVRVAHIATHGKDIDIAIYNHFMANVNTF
jgi:hypothetical protein